MTMIKILEAPTQNERHKFVSFPNLNGSHQFNLDNYDIRIYITINSLTIGQVKISSILISTIH